MSSLAISAETVAAGAWSTRVMLPWAVDLVDRGDGPEGNGGGRPDRQRPKRLDARDLGRVDLDVDRASGPAPASSWTVVATWPTRAVRTSPATWAAVSPAPIALFGIDDDLDLGRALREVGLQVEEVGVVGEGGHHLVGGGRDVGRVVAS